MRFASCNDIPNTAERDRRRAAEFADVGERAVQVHVRLAMDDDDAGLTVRARAGLDVLLEHRVAVVVGDHEVRLEWNLTVVTVITLKRWRRWKSVSDKPLENYVLN